MEKIEHSGIEILLLFLQKLEKLDERERHVVIEVIELLNKSIFVVPNR